MSGKNSNKLPNNLPQLQNLVKRDPGSYHEEFLQQLRHYKSSIEIFQINPTQFYKPLADLLIFLAQVSHCYNDDLGDYPTQLCEILRQHSTQLNPDMRLAMCKALILMRNKGLIQPTILHEIFFELFRCQDKSLRKFLVGYIVNDIKNVNAKHKDLKLNRTLQNFMYSMLEDNNRIAVRMSLGVLIELYRKNIWRDTKTVNVISTALFSKITKVSVAALKFFTGDDTVDDDDSDDEREHVKTQARESIDHLRLSQKVGKHTKKKYKKLRKVQQYLNIKQKKQKCVSFNFSALHLLHDPQDLSEKLFRHLENLNEKFEVKVMYLNLISRLVGVHELMLLNFYPYVQRFLKPHQRDVTKILLYTAQASHSLVPPDIIESVLMTIANNFITERNSSQVMTVGVNAVREICTRCPLAMNDTLLQDLAQYKNYKDKGVMTAAKSLIQLYRAVNPSLLHKKHRGPPVNQEMDDKETNEYAALSGKDYVLGAEVLESEEEGAEWESASEDEANDESDGDWVDVIHSDEEAANEEDKKVLSMPADERKEKARAVLESRILTQEDFARIRKVQALKAAGLVDRPKGGKRKAVLIEKPVETGEILPISTIENIHKTIRPDKKARLAAVEESKKDRTKYGHREHNPDAGVTNKVQRKNKTFQMLKHKINKKSNKRSFRDKQIALRDSLIKQRKRK